jgi:hypothetical protein
MRTTVQISDEKMKRIKRFFPRKTKKFIINSGLDLLLRDIAYKGLISMGGKFPDLKIDLDALRERDHYKKFL